jgi:hypothetical protein
VANNHYDVIILGESLASRIAAVLLAKAGRRVLLTGSPATAPCPAWIPASLHLERLLDLLDDRSCLVSAPPFQVLSGQVRLTLHGISALHDELRREFPADSIRVQQLLRELDNKGKRLETALLESAGLPLTGWASRWQFMGKRLLKGLTLQSLAHPLADKLKTGNSAQTVQALSALFSGLALRPIEHLSVAEGALLWRGFAENQGVPAADLNALLSHLFEQFHGEQVSLAELKSVQTKDRRLREAVFINDRRCTAEVFLLGSRDAKGLLPGEFRAGEAAEPPPLTLEARITDGAISPLLAQFVILAGSPPLRITLVPDSVSSHCRVICQATVPANDTSGAPQLEGGLSELFPFATLHFEQRAGIPSGPTAGSGNRSRRQKAFPGATSSLIAGEHLLNCCGEQVLPGLGATGEIMVAVSVVNYLQRQKRR